MKNGERRTENECELLFSNNGALSLPLKLIP